MTYEPVAYLGSQIVAGTNHLILCKAAAVTENPTTTYALQDAEEPIAGAYEEPETPVVTDDAKAALAKACETLTGAGYEAKALLGTQVVAGTNYMLLCKVTTVTAEPTSDYAIVTVYQDLEGNAEITETYNLASSAEDDGAAATVAAQSSEG